MSLLERQVQFALLENPLVLESVVGFTPTLVAAYLDISNWGFSGQIDFVLADPAQKKYVTELEIVVNSKSKVEHVVEQVVRYHQAANTIYSSDYTILILLASQSPERWRHQISNRLSTEGVGHEFREYDLEKIEKIYAETLDKNEAVFGLLHEDIRPSPVASFAQLNEIFAHFKEANADRISDQNLFQLVSWKTYVSYRQRTEYARNLGLLVTVDGTVSLTESGKRFRDYTNIPYRESSGPYYDLSEPQKRILRQNILVELRTSTQINRLVMQLVTFLQYLVLVQGKFIPRNFDHPLPDGVIAIFRQLIQRQYSLEPKTITRVLYWNSLYCKNLGLVRIIDDGPFNRVLFTEEGAQMYRLINDLINIRREESKIMEF